MITVILFGLFAMYENRNLILQRLLETPLFSLILKLKKTEKSAKISGKNVQFSVFQSEVRPVFLKSI